MAAFIEKAKTASDAAAQKAAGLREQAAAVAASVAGKASSLAAQTATIAGGLREHASALSAGIADAAIESSRVAMAEFTAALPLLKTAGYTVSELAVELGVPPKVVALFTLAQPLTDEKLEDLLQANAEAKLATMMLRTLSRAHKLQDGVQVAGLHPKGIAVELGFSPSVTIKFGT